MWCTYCKFRKHNTNPFCKKVQTTVRTKVRTAGWTPRERNSLYYSHSASPRGGRFGGSEGGRGNTTLQAQRVNIERVDNDSSDMYWRSPTPPIDELDDDNEEYGATDVSIFCVIVKKIAQVNNSNTEIYEMINLKCLIHTTPVKKV